MKFSKREWILFIIIISLVQGFVWYSAFVNAGNGSALNFISFAGTLISIILAVLAIGYTYGESITQKNHSDTVVSQISKLNDAIDTIRDQTESFNKIKDISETLAQYSEKVDLTHQEVRSINSIVKELTGPINQPLENSINNLSDEAQQREFIKKLVEVRLPVTEIAVLCIILSEGKFIQQFIARELRFRMDKIKEHHNFGEKHSDIENVLLGSIFVAANMLLAQGLIYYNENRLFLASNILKDYFLESVKNAPIETSSFHKALRDDLFESIMKM
ncbi:hypothetical protein NMR56_001858 [Vibrio cholerae]|nr:hypothetical protein [Vibrio cholerae]